MRELGLVWLRACVRLYSQKVVHAANANRNNSIYNILSTSNLWRFQLLLLLLPGLCSQCEDFIGVLWFDAEEGEISSLARSLC
jgi:hypothetical protein